MKTKLGPDLGHIQEPMSGAEGGAQAWLSTAPHQYLFYGSISKFDIKLFLGPKWWSQEPLIPFRVWSRNSLVVQ